MAAPQLPFEDFLHAVRLGPLVSIDLIVRDRQDRVLLGLRRNEPARGTWFVPGGRIAKDERLDQAYARIAAGELGLAQARRAQARFLGVYEHFYETNAGERPGFGTHYVVLGYELRAEPAALPAAQHSDYRWLAVAELLADEAVHEYTKAYFRQIAG